jgi:hypothetical protein
MRRFAMKALASILTLNRTGGQRPDWARIIRIFSTAVTVGLAALYVYGKLTSRW